MINIGSPSMRREWIEMISVIRAVAFIPSPSMRREWIEMQRATGHYSTAPVSLHAEGVD